MRISDWSSDVCSSDLLILPQAYPSPSFSDLRRHHLNQCNYIAECLLLFLYSVHRPPHPPSPEGSLYALIRPRPDAFAGVHGVQHRARSENGQKRRRREEGSNHIGGRTEEQKTQQPALMSIHYAVLCVKKNKNYN